MKARKRKLTDDEVIELYLAQLKTMEEIGQMAGVSKVAINNVLIANNVQYRGGQLARKCRYCGSAFLVRRKAVKKGVGHYCSVQCSALDRSLGRDMSIPSRLGRAALINAGHTIPEGAVVHHIDGNRLNNDLSNLRVFDTQREHMQFHHSLRNKDVIQVDAPS